MEPAQLLPQVNRTAPKAPQNPRTYIMTITEAVKSAVGLGDSAPARSYFVLRSIDLADHP
jgi:hypothetical protein